MVTQKEIAKKLSVSRSLVGRALRGDVEVSSATRRRIEAAAREMGYDLSTNQGARALAAHRYGKRARTGSIAVAFPPINNSLPHHMPFYAPFLAGIEDEAEAMGIEVCLMQIRLGGLPRLIRERNVDGIVSVGFAPQDVAVIQAVDLPIVTYQSVCDNAHSLMADDRQGGYLLTRHLLDQGHRAIAFLGIDCGPSGAETNALRLQGYRDALKGAGVEFRDELVDCTLPQPNTASYKYCSGCGRCGACIGLGVLREKGSRSDPNSEALPFTAVVCYHDPIAMGVIRQAESLGLRVPHDLSVVGFDNISGMYHFAQTVTSIDFPRYEMGRKAMELLAREGSEGQCERCIFPVTLAVHDTTTAPAAR